YINDASGSVEPLYPAMENLSDSELIQESVRITGAALMGRKSFEMAGSDYDWSTYEYQVPLFVLTHHPPKISPKSGPNQSFTFMTDGVESAIRQAKAAAGNKDVAVIPGASATNQVLLAGLADELHIEVMPILLGGGLRPFGAPDLEKLKLERIKLVGMPGGGIHIRYRINR
ncbi:MAG: dihydrofolate reductase family protein, partial [Anaerolineales bacterium]